jgi:predicted 3-demethylubiquinone-9 3-methyltransferase (glyoxalase superfamily)
VKAQHAPVKIIQHLWFERDMEAAIARYIELIAGSKLGWIRQLAADTPSGPAGSVKMAAFTLGGQDYMAIEAGKLDPFNRSFSIVAECEDQAEIDRLWDALTQGGSPGQCGWLRDRWGLSWQIIPRHFAEMMADPAKTGRLMQAVLKMTKFDIAALQEAASRAN